MSWYKGSIAEAVQESKNSSKLFVVFVAGNDETSTKMIGSWQDNGVQEVCREKCVCLKLEAESVECKQFSQIYPVILIPITFIIGKNGTPLDILSGHVTASDLREKLLNAVKDLTPGTTNDTPSTSNVTSQSVNNAPITQSSETTSFSDDETFTEKTESQQSEVLSAPGETEETEEEKEERVRKLQEKIQQRRLDKAKQAEEEERNSEIERRRIGKDVLSMREQQQKIKMMKEIEERKKDKQMEIEARRKVREQLAQDRLERASRFQQEKEGKTREEENRKKLREVKMTQEEEEKMREREKTARIQFRFPNGSSITRNYPREQTLGEAIEDLREQPVILPGNFRLAIGIPRRVFTSEEEGQSLGDLGLNPSLSLSIQPVPISQQVHARQDSSFFIQIYTFIVMFLSLPFKLLAYVWSAIFGGNQNATNTDNTTGSGRYDSVRPGSDTSGVRRRNVPGKSVTREGKMHRLSDVADKDDDDATWNGNSTQQM
ncbi:LOW QUALITY PROTEIN: UBX domain-containing protein 4 [Ciona intestinalis]